MIHDLFNGPDGQDSPGTACAGSSEAVMLGALSMKWNWKNRRKDAGKSDATPNLVYGADVHVVWDKFCRYFDVEPREVPVPKGKTTMSGRGLPRPHRRKYDRRRRRRRDHLHRPVRRRGRYRRDAHRTQGQGLEVPMHIDAASGGFVFPFSHPDFEWDFRLDSVVSVNVSGHKFGLVYPGIGWLVTRTDSQVPEDLIFYEDYLGQKDATFTLNFSGSSSFVLAQYYQFIRLGHSGYSSTVQGDDQEPQGPGGPPQGRRRPDRLRRRQSDAAAADRKDQTTKSRSTAMTWSATSPADRGWMIPAYQMPPDNENDRIMRMLVKLNQTRELVDALADDFSASIKYLRARAGKKAPGPAAHTGHGY